MLTVLFCSVLAMESQVNPDLCVPHTGGQQWKEMRSWFDNTPRAQVLAPTPASVSAAGHACTHASPPPFVRLHACWSEIQSDTTSALSYFDVPRENQSQEEGVCEIVASVRFVYSECALAHKTRPAS